MRSSPFLLRNKTELMCTSWHLKGQKATTRIAGREGHLDLGEPDQGFNLGGPPRRPLRLLRFHNATPPTPTLTENAGAYVRNDDLVINYGGNGILPFHLQIYWGRRSYPSSVECNGLEWTLAMQTESPDCRSRLATSTTGFGAQELLHLPASDAKQATLIESTSTFCGATSTGCILVRLGDFSYLELIHPQDFISAEVVWNGEESDFSINRTVFDCLLEKGVIVRARLFGLCVPRDNDVEILRAAYQAFIASQLPLTT
ncbi:MAG: hypothetical protein VXZ84_09150 [Planctomycetota bacterium]|nr:hypothetical protein [Planctomycetota bacterium]